MAKQWRFSEGRKKALRKAQKVHVLYVEAGKRALHKK
jgi:hypothetical protein